MSAELYWLQATLLLTALLAFPYVLNRMYTRGILGAMDNPSDDDTPLDMWAQRAQKAHSNAVENLVMFAPAVLLVEVTGANSSISASACVLYFFSRSLHYIVYTLGIPIARTLMFFGGWAAVVVLLAVAGGVL